MTVYITLGLEFLLLMLKCKTFLISKNPHSDVMDFQWQ